MQTHWLQGKRKLHRLAYLIAGKKAHVIGQVGKELVDQVMSIEEGREHYRSRLLEGYQKIEETKDNFGEFRRAIQKEIKANAE